MTLVGVRVEQPSNAPIVLLKEADGARYLPIWVGAVEATAIAFALQGEVSPMPLTHELFCDVLNKLGVQLLNVTVSALTDGIFESYLSLSGHGTVTCRPSDGIALAVRTGAPIFASTKVLDVAGVALPGDDIPLSGSCSGPAPTAPQQPGPHAAMAVTAPLTSMARSDKTRTKPRTNGLRFRRTEPDVPRHESRFEVQ